MDSSEGSPVEKIVFSPHMVWLGEDLQPTIICLGTRNIYSTMHEGIIFNQVAKKLLLAVIEGLHWYDEYSPDTLQRLSEGLSVDHNLMGRCRQFQSY